MPRCTPFAKDRQSDFKWCCTCLLLCCACCGDQLLNLTALLAPSPPCLPSAISTPKPSPAQRSVSSVPSSSAAWRALVACSGGAQDCSEGCNGGTGMASYIDALCFTVNSFSSRCSPAAAQGRAAHLRERRCGGRTGLHHRMAAYSTYQAGNCTSALSATAWTRSSTVTHRARSSQRSTARGRPRGGTHR